MSTAVARPTLGFDGPAWAEVDRLQSKRHLLTLRTTFRAIGGDREREERRKRRQWQHWQSAMDVALDSLRRQTTFSPDISMPKEVDETPQTKPLVPASSFRFSLLTRPRQRIQFPFPEKTQMYEFTFTKPGAPSWHTLQSTLTRSPKSRPRSVTIGSRRRCIEQVDTESPHDPLVAHSKRLLDKCRPTERTRLRMKALWRRKTSSMVLASGGSGR